jgi:acetyl-CoA acetyltransferase
VIRVLSSEARCSGSEPNTVVARAARLAYERAGIGPEDVNVAEVHDAVAPAEIEEYEHLGFASEGEGHVLLRSGETALGGRLPVNTSGGLLSRGHPVGATGVLQIVELVDQLRGRAGARQVEPRPVHALAQNAGGLFDGDPAVAVVTILTSDQGG